MGGKKRTIEIKKIENKSWKTVAFSKRRTGLFSKASKLCLLSGAKIAILMTPISSKSNVSFYSFGHSSVDSVVSSFLANHLPRDDNIEEAPKDLGFWWEDERFAKSENPIELSDAMDSISSMLQNLKGLQSEAVENRREREDLKKKKKKKNVVSHGTHQEFDQNQTLKFQTSSPSKADSPANIEGFIKNSEEKDQLVVNYDNNMNKDVVLNGTHQELDQNQTLNLQSCPASIGIQDCSPTSFEGLIKNSEEEDQIVVISDENNNGLLGYLEWCNKELGLDEVFHFETNNSEGISMDDVSTNQNSCSDSDEVTEDRTLVIHRGFDENNQHLSDLDKDQNITSSDNNNNGLHGDLDVCNQESDKYFDFLMNCEDLSMNLEMDDISTNQNMCLDYEAIEDGVAMLIHKEFDEDNLHFSDYFSMKNFEDNGGIGSISFG